MKAKIKSGYKSLFSEGCSNNWDDLKDNMIINFYNKYTYNGFKQVRNHLLIECENGLIDIVFTGEIPRLGFDHYEKDQLVLKIN